MEEDHAEEAGGIMQPAEDEDAEEFIEPDDIAAEYEVNFATVLCMVTHIFMSVCCCCCCCFLTLTDPLRIQPWSQDRRNQTKSTGNRR